MKVQIAFYKAEPENWRTRFIRWWTQSPYLHAELIIQDHFAVGISPEDDSEVRMKHIIIDSDWETLDIHLADDQYFNILRFFEKTKGQKYDWVGMLLSQFTPFSIKHDRKWYCSQWIAHALMIAGVFPVTYEKITPAKLHSMLLETSPAEISKDPP